MKRSRARMAKKAGDDCLRCCVAWLLGKRRCDVPHFVRRYRGRWDWRLAAWLKRRGLTLAKVRGRPLVWGQAPYIACGPTKWTRRNKQDHAVVMVGGAVVYDPAPGEIGLLRITRSYLLVKPWRSLDP